ncbi:MAG: pyridoxine/pyridoxal/pyridoxamine kinase [Lautropia sp.]|nr:pyridoxine/pyridoxal/pyridoxamine kinase [Lautropia sp.]
MNPLQAREGGHFYHESLKPLPLDIVSIQSQVVYGRVGNNVAGPVLMRAGLEVAIVPTVVFSNTPHYPSIHGGSIPDEWFSGYLDDLQARQALDRLRAVLIGYLGSPTQTARLSTWLKRLRAQLPELQIIIDPVMGDEDSGMYVAQGMLEGYRAHLLAQASGLTPNGFELRCLTDMPVDTQADVCKAARTLLNDHTRWVVVTSAAPGDCPPDQRQVMIVTHEQAKCFRHRNIDSAVKGTGDLFSAILCERLLAGQALTDAVHTAAHTVVQALENTRDAGSGELLLPKSA